jgi:tRNA uridine 5-carboxymethylaminomethyl modification enzyme
MAGLNAALSLRGEEPLVFKRDEAYIGVLIDDLVTKGTDGEPYRMFTSRAEYRLLLREDNADLRLTEIGYKIGAVGREAHARLERKRDGVATLLRTLEQTAVNPDAANCKIEAFGSAPIRGGTTLAQLLKRPELAFAELREFAPNLEDIPLDIALQAEVEIKYAGYIDRQLETVRRAKNFEGVRLPDDLDYATVTGLSREAREKLSRIRPRSLGQASRIAGITPAAISLLSIYLHKRKIAG